MPEVSVIIPVYNSSSYLPECLQNVLAQSLHDIEIICINDGSTDHSLQILKDFRTRDTRIKIIDKENQGVSAARNAGLDIAQGKYIGFVDSDDTVEMNFFEMLLKAAEDNNADIVFSKNLSDSLIITPNTKYDRAEIQKLILPLFFKEDGYNAIWNKLYSAEVININKIIFPVDTTHGEDQEFNIQFLIHAVHLYVMDYSGYHYRINEGSATRNAKKFDYLQQAVNTFAKDWTPIIGQIIDAETMRELKKERFINNIIAQIYIYANPDNGLSLQSRLRKISGIVENHSVIKIFNENNLPLTYGFSRYKKSLYQAIRQKSVFKLYLLSMYSYYRSK